MMTHISHVLTVAWLTIAASAIAPHAAAETVATANSCLACHAAQTDGRLTAPAALFTQSDVHRESGFGCVDCHGGNSSAPDKAPAHDIGRGFKGKPAGETVIATCARCHNDAEFMHRFAPRQRVDQATEYATSVHGKRLASGDMNVAT